MATLPAGTSLFVMCFINVAGWLEPDEPIRKARSKAPELFIKAPERAAKDGYPLETHFVQTADGYILGVHRIPGGSVNKPIFLQHGVASMSDSWLVPGHDRSLAYQLADKGYDIWMGNVRGNLYSKNHTTLKPSNEDFWKFSWHEIGIYDLPAMIDYILGTTGHKQIIYVGLSMGGTLSYVLLSMRPDYNAKISLVVSLAPAVYLNHSSSRVGRTIIKNRNVIKSILDTTHNYELLPFSEASISLPILMCGNGSLLIKQCGNLVIETCGKSEEFDLAEIPTMFYCISAGVSAFTLWHYMQVILTGTFKQFDFGPKENMLRYGSLQPPEYDLSLNRVPVSLHYGSTDAVVDAKDVEYLGSILPNVIEVRKVPSKYFSHLDFIMSKKLKELLFEDVIRRIDQYQ